MSVAAEHSSEQADVHYQPTIVSNSLVYLGTLNMGLPWQVETHMLLYMA